MSLITLQQRTLGSLSKPFPIQDNGLHIMSGLSYNSPKGTLRHSVPPDVRSFVLSSPLAAPIIDSTHPYYILIHDAVPSALTDVIQYFVRSKKNRNKILNDFLIYFHHTVMLLKNIGAYILKLFTHGKKGLISLNEPRNFTANANDR